MKLLNICVTLEDVWNIVDIKFKDKSENIEVETLFISKILVKNFGTVDSNIEANEWLFISDNEDKVWEIFDSKIEGNEDSINLSSTIKTYI